MNPKLIIALASIAGVTATGFIAYRIGEEVGIAKTEKKYLSIMEQIEQRSIELEDAESALKESLSSNTSTDTTKATVSTINTDSPTPAVIWPKGTDLDSVDEEDPDTINVAGVLGKGSLPGEVQFHEPVDDLSDADEKALSQIEKDRFLEQHPYEGSKKKTTEEKSMEADKAYIASSLRYITEPRVTQQLIELDDIYVEQGPAVDQIMWENSVSNRNVIRASKGGLDLISQPTWFDMYIYFLRDFSQDPDEINIKARELLSILNGYLNNYDPVNIEEVLYAFSMNIAPVGAPYYSPFGLTQQQVNKLEENRRNDLSGQRNEWLNDEMPLI